MGLMVRSKDAKCNGLNVLINARIRDTLDQFLPGLTAIILY